MDIISGKIVKGRGLGKKMGFPTLNIPYKGKLRGVFVARVFIDGKSCPAAVSVGPRPTINDESVFCEAYLVDFDGDITEDVKVELVEKIRDIKKFNNLEELKAQIAKDVEFVKKASAKASTTLLKM